MTEGVVVTLEEAIAQCIADGMEDPVAISRQIQDESEHEWLRDQLGSIADWALSELARRRLSSTRRWAELALREGDALSQAELLIARYWIPGAAGGTWKTASDLTPEDLRARAAWYEELGRQAIVRAQWCREVANKMDEDGARTLNEFKRDLPPLASATLKELAATI